MRISRIILTAVIVVGAASVASYYVLEREGKGSGEAGAPPQAASKAAPQQPRMTGMPVPVAAVIKKTIPIVLEYPGRTESISAVTLLARIAGYVAAQPAPDGADVKEGDLLYKIDTRDLQAALDQITAQSQRDSAALDYARANYGRGTELAKTGFVDKDTFEQRASAMRQAEAALAMDQAAIRTAKLNLGYAEIRAPFAGRLGRNQAPVGTLVSVGNTALNTLVQLDPIYVTFNPSETDLPAIEKARVAGRVEAEILLPDEPQAGHKGALTFIDNAIDRTTGTITARATIANGDFTLLPGQYVRVRLHIKDQPDALMVPQVAIGSSQLGKYVYVVADGKVDQRLVTLGPTDGPLVAITKGVAEGDQVITGNLQKIGPGAPVQPMPAKAGTGT
ncbi:MAG: efflux RND transporter periplasmic adaptor subunit [Hyphomicrobiales bacterium]